MKTVARVALLSACGVVLLGLTGSPLQAADVALKSGDVIRLKCLGNHPNSTVYWLAGNSKAGTVELVKDKTTDGTQWLVEKGTDGGWLLRCVDERKGTRRYLHANDQANKVYLQKNNPEYTSSRWQLVVKEGNVVHLRSVEFKEGPRWLYGHTVKGFVDLAEDAKDPLAGAEWLLEKQ
jgi:hypothetical protein